MYKKQYGVELICRVLEIAPSTYYAAVVRPPSVRALNDVLLKEAIQEIWTKNRCVYGIEKIWASLRRAGWDVARCTVERLMHDLGISGIVRGRGPKTTVADEHAARPDDLVKRSFTADAPNRLWVADITYVKTHSGWVYVAFIIDVFSRNVVGWQASRSLRTDLALDALNMALWQRGRPSLAGLVHHSDRGVQYTALRYTERLEGSGVDRSVGSRGDSYDNALAESFNGLYKTELVHKDGPWHGLEDVEFATMEYVNWFTNERLHSSLGMVSPATFEAQHANLTAQQTA